MFYKKCLKKVFINIISYHVLTKGILPTEIGSLVNLKKLYLEGNALNGIKYRINFYFANINFTIK